MIGYEEGALNAGDAGHLVPLVVVGGGPVGVAALYFAARAGIPAVGLEAGEGPLRSVRGYMDGLALSSASWHYEVAGLPLDGRDPMHPTREEVLRYYARVIEYGQLDLRCRTRCVGLDPGPDHVLVRVQTSQGEGALRARRVVVTSWYRPRALPALEGSGVRVLRGVRDPGELAGRAVVVVGGGISAREQAAALMMNGQRVTWLARSALVPPPREWLRALARATGSVLVEGAANLAGEPDGVAYAEGAGGPRRRVRCDVVVLCIGQELDPSVLGMLRCCGALSEREAQGLTEAPTPNDGLRRGVGLEEAIREAVEARPDLSRQLFEGHRGIHLAGGALHVGGSHAGVVVSIHTAELAVGAVAGSPRPTAGPLPAALSEWAQERHPPAPSFATVAPLRPLRLQSRSRAAPILSREGPEGGPRDPEAEGTATPYLHGDGDAARWILASDGEVSLAELAARAGITSADGLQALAERFYALWQDQALTWLPPRR